MEVGWPHNSLYPGEPHVAPESIVKVVTET
jgi:hypothetical protein